MRIEDGSNKYVSQQDLLNKIKDRYRVRKDIKDIRDNTASDNIIEKNGTDKNLQEILDTLVLSEKGYLVGEDEEFQKVGICTDFRFFFGGSSGNPDGRTAEQQLLLEYAQAYDSIVHGQVIFVADKNSESGCRKLSMQEAIAELDNAFARVCEGYQKYKEEGREILKKMAEEAEDLIKRYGTAGPWHEDALERYNLVKDQEIPKDLGKRVYNASKVFIQRYKQASDVLSIEEMLKGITI